MTTRTGSRLTARERAHRPGTGRLRRLGDEGGGAGRSDGPPRQAWRTRRKYLRGDIDVDELGRRVRARYGVCLIQFVCTLALPSSMTVFPYCLPLSC